MTKDLPQRIREPHEGNHLSRPRRVGEVPCTGQVRESYHSGVPVPDPGEQHVDQNSYFSRLRTARAVVLSPLGSSARSITRLSNCRANRASRSSTGRSNQDGDGRMQPKAFRSQKAETAFSIIR